MKDYYGMLGVAPEASPEEIRAAYRRLALRYHPDRNPGDSRAEDRFKEVAEAYGVLCDPDKRGRYDAARTHGAHQGAAGGPGGGFRDSQEEIFRDLFRDPRFQRMAGELFREFQRAGLRADRRFFDRVFFGGRGIFMAGFFVFGPSGPARVSRPGSPALRRGTPPLLKAVSWVGRKIANALGAGEHRPALRPAAGEGRERDLTYRVALDPDLLREGTTVTVAVPRDAGRETFRVRVPPGTRPGTRLRLRGKGRPLEGVRGDLFLEIDRT
jgi:DnaJ-class molecular chaperone